MGAFMFAAMSLVAVTLLLLLRPWQQARSDPRDASGPQVNAGVHRDQLAELDRDLAAGVIAPADHAAARDELQRRLLDDTSDAATARVLPAHGRHTVLALAIALPLGASALYAILGEPAALLARPAPAASAHDGVASPEIEGMVAGLAARLEKNPGDKKGWAMLARSYHAMGRNREAVAAFERLGDAVHQDASLLAVYADVLATSAGGKLEGVPIQLVGEALRLDPDHPMALSLAATAAYNRRDFPTAADHWQRLLRQLPADSDDARFIQKTLAEIGAPIAAVAQAGPAAPTAPQRANTAPGQLPPAPVAAGSRTVSGIVSLAPSLQAGARPDDTVFVFARSTDGSRMPLAVQRARVADLPLTFRLDDSMAMSPQAKLSDAKAVRIEARVSRQGSANPAAGDLIGASEPVAPGAERLALIIDRVRE
ncbi:MAG: c-type cytochrome biogenesis protein CcmI [Caldimonas sp.]